MQDELKFHNVDLTRVQNKLMAPNDLTLDKSDYNSSLIRLGVCSTTRPLHINQ